MSDNINLKEINNLILSKRCLTRNQNHNDLELTEVNKTERLYIAAHIACGQILGDIYTRMKIIDSWELYKVQILYQNKFFTMVVYYNPQMGLQKCST